MSEIHDGESLTIILARNKAKSFSSVDYTTKKINYSSSSFSSKNHEVVKSNPPIRIYVNKMGIRISIKITTGYYLELVPPKKTKLLESSKNNITNKIKKDKIYRI